MENFKQINKDDMRILQGLMATLCCFAVQAAPPTAQFKPVAQQQMKDAWEFCQVYAFVNSKFADYSQQQLPQAQWRDRLLEDVKEPDLADEMMRWNNPENYQGLSPDSAKAANLLSCLDEKVGSQDPAQQTVIRQDAQRCQRDSKDEDAVRKCFIQAQGSLFSLALKASKAADSGEKAAANTTAENEQDEFCSDMSTTVTGMYSFVLSGQDTSKLYAKLNSSLDNPNLSYLRTRLDWLLQTKSLKPAAAGFLVERICDIEGEMPLQTQTRWSMPQKALECQNTSGNDQKAMLQCIDGALTQMMDQATQLQVDLLKPDVQMTDAIRADSVATASMPNVAAIRRFINDVLADRVQKDETQVKAQLLALGLPRSMLQERWILSAGYGHAKGGSRYVLMSKSDHKVNLEFWSYQAAPGEPWVIREVKRVEPNEEFLQMANTNHRNLLKDPMIGL